LAFGNSEGINVSIGTVATAIEESHVITVTTETLLGTVALAAGPVARQAGVLNLNINKILSRIKIHTTLILTELCGTVVVVMGRETLPGLDVYDRRSDSNKCAETDAGDRLVDFDSEETASVKPVPHVVEAAVAQFRSELGQAHDEVVFEFLRNHFLAPEVVQCP
jgi:hypothetical protein